jgi:WD40 repeat protein
MHKKTRFALALVPFIAVGCTGTELKPAPPLKKLSNAGESGGSALAINQKSDRLASGGWSGKLKVWNLPKGETQRIWQAHDQSVAGIAYGSKDQYLVSAGYEGDIAIWQPDGELIKRWASGSPITAFVMAPSRNEVVTGHKDGWVRHWRVRDNALLAARQVQRDEIRSLGVSPDGEEIAVADDGAHLSLWQPQKNLLKHFARSPSYSRSLAFSPDGKNVYGSGWFNVYRWNRADGKLDVLPTDHHGIINSIHFTPKGELASISRQTDSSVLVLDPKDGKTLAAYEKHDLCGGKLAVSADGCFLATNSDDATVRVWALENGCAMPKRELIGSR